MTSAAQASVFSPGDRARIALLVGLGFQLALLGPTLAALLLDTRLIDGVSVWSKPLKFQLSLAMTIGTVLLFVPFLTEKQMNAAGLGSSAFAIAFASIGEIAYICLQAARGARSHFNFEVFAGLGYALMGVGAVSIVAGCFWIGLALLRAPASPGRDGLRLGAGVGLMLGAALTLVTAGLLSTGYFGPGHWIGGALSDAAGLPLVGWSTTGGDLRVPHFFATHVMQALPLLGWLADRAGVRRPARVLALGSALGTAIVFATLAQALAGRPFWS